MTKPDFYMTSADSRGEWARLRKCWIERRVSGPYHSQYAVVRIDPPGLPKNQTTAVETILISPHHAGETLFPLSDDPLSVYVYTAVRSGALEGEHVQQGDVRIEAWCEVYRDRSMAETVAAAACED